MMRHALALTLLCLTACSPVAHKPDPEPITKIIRETPPLAYMDDVSEPQPADQTIGAKLSNRLDLKAALTTCRSQLQATREWSTGIVEYETFKATGQGKAKP
jgi:hypothetical protein